MADYLKLVGRAQGQIAGAVTLPGRENSIEAIAWSHEVVVPRDMMSGSTTVRRQHRPLTIAKEVDKATPKLLKALITNEVMASCSLECWRPDPTGRDKLYYRVDLTNAIVAGIVTNFPSEQVTFHFQKIVFTWVDGNIVTEDSLY